MSHKLDFILPVFNSRIKVRIGDINELFDKYKPNIIPPVVGFYQPYDEYDLICLSEDRWKKDVSHECGHIACEILRSRGMKICDETEEMILMIQDYLVDYIKENV